ncbi:hypothetical protein [Mesorhizobium sp.]|nr:hypothetical protein [Mesorhizobium sp.]RWN51569.1 MAG: hypothetical protein EOR98_25725 [Mesorhizobium sp.]RWN71764.1 MAG: hypothetical protein EOS02_29670 [Mesorhizobium sp.]RWN73612.1 MAG: hypothetical protein EOS01_25880 [Mesorhizobium sp.]RWN85473.1 MAG: hypothetical protein EOS04_22755 [Mesorhizobium sp.]RWO09541.1 MAG: hypothetical protein EOS15_26815 [Mesorhizobium sp.]
MTNPSKHAWDLFLALNYPAKNPAVERGVPDPQKALGDDGLTVWETWKHGEEVFLANGAPPPKWEDMSLDPSLVPNGKKLFEIPKTLVLEGVRSGMSPDQAVRADQVSKVLKVAPDGIFRRGGGETRMNRSTFDFIVEKELYNIEGQEALYAKIVSRTEQAVSFPVDSIEVKAMWTPLEPSDDRSHFHLSVGADAKSYKLVALHIITKDVPNWFWTSFRQTDGPEPEIPSVDTYGQPGLLQGTKWQFYELSGTQTDFTDGMGRPTYLSDPHVEEGFQNSSCISCHALSTIGRKGPKGADGSSEPEANRIAFFNVMGSPTGAPVGVPNPGWFFEPVRFGQDVQDQDYIQLDFLFSPAFRANRKSP